MKLKSKFNIHDLVQHKYQKSQVNPAKELVVSMGYEVLQIRTETCYGGTQIFYDVRMFHASFLIEITPEGKKYVFSDIGHGMRKSNETPFSFREDELIEMDQFSKDLILAKEVV